MMLRKPVDYRLPWYSLVGAVASMAIQCHLDWRNVLLYDHGVIASGQWWRLWTGHLVHFGWPHLIADTGLFLILGFVLERSHTRIFLTSLLVLPLAISAALFSFDPSMKQYGGLSAINLALLLFVAGLGWQRNWVDWFWPAVLLVYIGEILLESTIGQGAGGGMIRFDDPSIHVATSAHLAAAVCAAVMLVGMALWKRSGSLGKKFSDRNRPVKI